MENIKNVARGAGWRLFVLYVVLAMVIQWPVVGSITTHISYGQEHEITVPLLNLWTVWWNSDRAAKGFSGYWNAPIFYPTEKTFVFSEAQPASLVVAPVIWLTGNRCLAYNVYQLLILALNGFTADRLLRRVGHIPWLAFCGGVMSQILPFVIWQFGVVQLTTLFGIHWTLHAVFDLFETDRTEQRDRGSTRWTVWNSVGIRLGLAFGLTYWLCNYWGLFLTLLLIPSSVCFWNRRLFAVAFWKHVAFSALIALVMIGPFAWLQRSLAHEHNWQSARTEEMVHSLSAHGRDHTDVPWYTMFPWLEFPEVDRDNSWALGGGGLKLLLIPIGVIAAMTTPHRRRWGLFSLVLGSIAFGLSLGPLVRFVEAVPIVGGICPYEFLQRYVPGFSLIRSPFRFAMFVQLAAVWLSLEALDLFNPNRWRTRQSSVMETQRRSIRLFLPAFWSLHKEHGVVLPSVQTDVRSHPVEAVPARGDSETLRSKSPMRWRLLSPKMIPLVLFSSIVTLESIPPVTRLFELPSRDGLPVWVVWLRDDAEPHSAVACLPFPQGFLVGDYEVTTIWMYWSTFHRRPLLNGYSGFFPASYNAIKEGLEQFDGPASLEGNSAVKPHFSQYRPDNVGLKLLNQSGARYVVVKRSFATRDDIWMHPATRFRWALVLSDEIEKIDIYEIPSLTE